MEYAYIGESVPIGISGKGSIDLDSSDWEVVIYNTRVKENRHTIQKADATIVSANKYVVIVPDTITVGWNPGEYTIDVKVDTEIGARITQESSSIVFKSTSYGK